MRITVAFRKAGVKKLIAGFNPEELAEYDRILGQPEFEEVKQMITVYEQRGRIEGKRDALLKIARSRFGEPTAELVAAVEATETMAELDLLLERLLKAASPEEVVKPQ